MSAGVEEEKGAGFHGILFSVFGIHCTLRPTWLKSTVAALFANPLKTDS